MKLLPAHRILLTCWQGIFRGLLQYRFSPCRGSLFCRGPGNLSCVIAFPCCFCCLYYSPIRKICQTHFSTNKDHNLTSISFNSSLPHRFAAIKQPESQSNCVYMSFRRKRRHCDRQLLPNFTSFVRCHFLIVFARRRPAFSHFPVSLPCQEESGLRVGSKIAKRPGRVRPTNDALLHAVHIQHTPGEAFSHELFRYILIILFKDGNFLRINQLQRIKFL